MAKRRATKYCRNVIHVIANCRDCDWDCEDIETAQDKAREHAQERAHYVSVEVGIAVTYDYWNPHTAATERDG